MKKTILTSVFLLFGIMISACSGLQANTGSFASIPVGIAYAEGKEIYFRSEEHTSELQSHRHN
jgi:hypothetical protein